MHKKYCSLDSERDAANRSVRTYSSVPVVSSFLEILNKIIVLTLSNAGLSLPFMNSKSNGCSKYFILVETGGQWVVGGVWKERTHTKVPDLLSPNFRCLLANPNAISHNSSDDSVSLTVPITA